MIRPQTTPASLLFIILVTATLLSGCAALGPGIETPSITITDLRGGDMQGLEAVFTLELRVMNPNDFPLDIRGINCDLEIDGNRFATGLSDVRQEVPAFGTATIPVTVYASMFEMVASVIQIIQDSNQQHGHVEPLQYKLAGKIHMGGHGSVPFQSSGELDFNGQAQ